MSRTHETEISNNVSPRIDSARLLNGRRYDGPGRAGSSRQSDSRDTGVNWKSAVAVELTHSGNTHSAARNTLHCHHEGRSHHNSTCQAPGKNHR